MMNKKKLKGEILFYTVVILLCILLLFPIIMMLGISLKDNLEAVSYPSTIIPKTWTLEHYRYLFNDTFFDFPRYFNNSLYVASLTATISCIFGIMGGYALSRLRFFGRGFMNESLLFVYMFSSLLLIVPLYKLLTKIGLDDSREAVILCLIVQTLPTSVYMCRSYFDTLPNELEEAGLVDGLTRVGVIIRLVIPLALPGIVSVFVYAFMIGWNNILFPMMFLNSSKNMTLTRAMQQLFSANESNWGNMMAVSIMTGLPIIIMYGISQSFIKSGMADGSVKG